MKVLKTKVITYEEEVPTDLNEFRNWEFSSGGITGEDFGVFARIFKKFIKDNLPEESELIEFDRNHYYISGFIKRNDKFVYFSISDVRHFPNEWTDNILIRTAQHERDYTGGTNNYATLEGFKESVNGLL